MPKINRYLLAFGLALGAMFLIWVAAWLAVGAHLPPRTTLLGVDVSKLTSLAAKNKVESELAAALQREITLVIDDRKYGFPTAGSGLELDIEKSLDAVGKRSWNPAQLRSLLFDEKVIEPAISTNQELFDKAIKSIETKVTRAPRNADIVYEGLRPKIIKSVEGRYLDRKDALSRISAAWLRKDQISLQLKFRAPKVTDAEAERVFTLAKDAVAAPITLTLDLAKPVLIPIDPRVISQALTFTATNDGRLQPKWLKPIFVKLIGRSWSENLAEPINASFTMVNGQPRVQPSRDGLDVPEERLSQAILSVLDRTSQSREVTVAPEPVPAAITTEMAGGLGIKEVIGTFTTFFPYAEYRITNIHRAARWMDGVIVKPGEVFSYNKAVGERTAARGFVPGIMIDKGVFKKDLGGGVSQVATTTWNAACRWTA